MLPRCPGKSFRVDSCIIGSTLETRHAQCAACINSQAFTNEEKVSCESTSELRCNHLCCFVQLVLALTCAIMASPSSIPIMLAAGIRAARPAGYSGRTHVNGMVFPEMACAEYTEAKTPPNTLVISALTRASLRRHVTMSASHHHGHYVTSP